VDQNVKGLAGFRYKISDLFMKKSPCSHSLLVSDSVGPTSSCSLLAFPLLVNLASSCLHCLCFSVSILNS